MEIVDLFMEKSKDKFLNMLVKIPKAYDWYLGIVIKSAKEMVKYGHSTTQAGYYIQAPNNIVITLIIFIGIKLFNMLHIHNISLITLTINICFIQLAIFLTFKIILLKNNFLLFFIISYF